jgi:hypothetical protein
MFESAIWCVANQSCVPNSAGARAAENLEVKVDSPNKLTTTEGTGSKAHLQQKSQQTMSKVRKFIFIKLGLTFRSTFNRNSLRLRRLFLKLLPDQISSPYSLPSLDTSSPLQQHTSKSPRDLPNHFFLRVLSVETRLDGIVGLERIHFTSSNPVLDGLSKGIRSLN